MKQRLPISTVLLLMLLMVLAPPLSGVWALRLYESALIRQTESSLLSEAALAAAAFRSAWRANGGSHDGAAGPVAARLTHKKGFDTPWLPRFARLDLAEETVLSPPPDPQPAASAIQDEAARRAGETVAPLIREGQLQTLSGVRVLNRTGVVVASTGEIPVVGLSLTAQVEVARALLGEQVSVLRARTIPQGWWDNGGAFRVFVALPVLDEQRVVGAVLAWRTPPTIRDALYGKRRSLALLVLLTLAAVASFVALGVLTISRPLRTVTEQAKRTASGERGAMSPVAYPLVREVDELSQALTRMAATLEQRADYIRDFAAHVSHEFKTPLGAIRGAVELLREHFADMSPGERDRFLANLDADAERLTRLVTQLLELARADVMSASRESGAGADAAAVICATAERFRARGMTVEVKTPLAAARVAMGEEALETILVNLLNNARQHGGPDVCVTLSLRRKGDRAVLLVADNGPGVSQANAERIFAPFFTTARKTGGTGLGLSIVQSLAAAHGGTLALEPTATGAAFRVEAPLAAEGGD
jgi:signal transduction histidine kinase